MEIIFNLTIEELRALKDKTFGEVILGQHSKPSIHKGSNVVELKQPAKGTRYDASSYSKEGNFPKEWERAVKGKITRMEQFKIRDITGADAGIYHLNNFKTWLNSNKAELKKKQTDEHGRPWMYIPYFKEGKKTVLATEYKAPKAPVKGASRTLSKVPKHEPEEATN